LITATSTGIAAEVVANLLADVVVGVAEVLHLLLVLVGRDFLHGVAVLVSRLVALAFFDVLLHRLVGVVVVLDVLGQADPLEELVQQAGLLVLGALAALAA